MEFESNKYKKSNWGINENTAHEKNPVIIPTATYVDKIIVKIAIINKTIKR
ncbi:hypothetical protein FACS189459_6240 [Bacilli bacterium]|nr:hypothetical protein FACS189459_6240 [Bacilli bacterium]